jgi:hypothetical protein
MAKILGNTGSLLSKALQKASAITPVPIEVLISRKRNEQPSLRIFQPLWKNRLLSPNQIVIYANPVTRRAGVWSGPLAQTSLTDQDWNQWIRELEQDLHQTHPDRALALAVMSLSLALRELGAGVGNSVNSPAPHTRS